MANDTVTMRSITGRQTTAGFAEETVNLVLNGAAPVPAIPVPVRSVCVITDWDVCAPVAGSWRLQQTNDGSTWFDIGLALVNGFGASSTVNYNPRTGWVINGGANVAFRVRVTTPSGPALATVTIRSYTES
jgi:hypothetical protein